MFTPHIFLRLLIAIFLLGQSGSACAQAQKNANLTQMELRLSGGSSSNVDLFPGGRGSPLLDQEFQLSHQRAQNDYAWGFSLRGAFSTYTHARDADEREFEARTVFSRSSDGVKANLNLGAALYEETGRARIAPSALIDIDVVRGGTTFGLGLAVKPVFFTDMDGNNLDVRHQARDYIGFDGEFSLSQQLGPHWRAGPVLVLGRQEPLAAYDFFGLERGNSTLYGGIGAEYEHPKLTVSLEGGMALRGYDDPLFKRERFWSAEAKARYALSTRTALLVNADTHFDDDPLLVVKDTLVRTVGAGIAHQLSQKASVDILYAAEWSNFWGTSLHTLTHTAQGIGEYKFRHNLAAQLSIKYEHVAEPLAGDPAGNLELLAGLIIRNGEYKKDDTRLLGAVSPNARR